MRSGSAPMNPTAKDVEKQDPVKLLLDKHKKLKLDKTQIARLDTLGGRLREQNAPFYVRVDSLHKTFKVPSGGMQSVSDEDRTSMMENRQSLHETLAQVREHNHAARMRPSRCSTSRRSRKPTICWRSSSRRATR